LLNALNIPAVAGQTADVTINGGNVTVTIPSTGVAATVPANTVLAVIRQGSQPFAGAFPPNTPVGLGVDDTSADASATRGDSGITIDQQGALIQNLAVPVTDGVNGTPLNLSIPQGNVTGRVLTVHHWRISGLIYIRGGQVIIPIPTNLNGVIPNNGENAAGSFMETTWWPGNNGRHATLRVEYGNGFVLNQTKTIANNFTKFENIVQDASDVPGNGVDLVALRVGSLP
jgi:hypothetical protein